MKTGPGTGVALCGLGADPPWETTLEALRTMEESSVVFTDIDDPAVLRWLRRRLPALVPLGPRAPGAGVLRAARERRVSVAVWGHPFLSSRWCLGLAAQAAKSGIPVSVPAAVSPASSAFAMAKAFFGGTHGAHNRGIQVYDLGIAGARNSSLDHRLPLVVFCHGKGRGSDWRRFVRRLMNSFPADHRCFYFQSDGPWSQSMTMTLGELKGLAARRPGGVLLLEPILKSPRMAS